MSEVKGAILKKGYVYIGIRIKVTRNSQTNHTDIHAPLEKEYCKLEQEPLITLLRSAPNPKPTHDNMMQIRVESLQVLMFIYHHAIKILGLQVLLMGLKII